MKIKYLAVAVAAAFAAPVAQADVTIAGTIAPGMVYTNNGSGEAVTTATGAAAAATQSSSSFAPGNASNRFSITSTEDMGNGMTAGAFVDVRGQGGGFDNYNSTGNTQTGLVAFRYGASIGGGWGKFEFGRNFSPYTRTLIDNDPHGGAIFFAPFVIMGQAGGQGLWVNGGAGSTGHAFFRTGTGAHYFSPDINGFSFKASYMVEGAKTANNKEVSEFGFSADYAPADMPFYLGAAYSNRKNANGVAPMSAAFNTAQTVPVGVSSTDTVGLIGGGVKFGDLKVGVWLEQVKYKTDGVTAGLSELKRNALWIPANYTLPTGTLGAAYLMAGDLKGSNASAGGFAGGDTGAQSFQVSYIHNLSKQTQPIIMWQYVSSDKKGIYAGNGDNGFGATQNTVFIGLQHSF